MSFILRNSHSDCALWISPGLGKQSGVGGILFDRGMKSRSSFLCLGRDIFISIIVLLQNESRDAWLGWLEEHLYVGHQEFYMLMRDLYMMYVLESQFLYTFYPWETS